MQNRIFPSELQIDFSSLCKKEKGHTKCHRDIINSDSRHIFKDHPHSLIPISRSKISYHEDHKEVIENESPSNSSKRIRTAKGKQRIKIRSQQCPHTAQGSKNARPESRYNKATLHLKLEYGRTTSPEYKVPVVDMKFNEFMKQSIVPDCWKDGN